MCSVQHLRELISDRLTAAAEEIFTEFEKTIVQYKEEIDRQRRLLDVVWKPHVPLKPIVVPPELPQSYVFENERILIILQPCNQERNTMVDHEVPEPPQIKDQQEELCTSLHQANPELPQIKNEQEELCTSLNQANPELPQIKNEQEELCISLHQANPELPQIQKEQEELRISLNQANPELAQIQKEQEVLCISLNQANPELAQTQKEQEELCISLNQANPELAQTQKEQEVLCTSQEEEQFGRKQEINTFGVTAAHEESDHSEPKSNSDQLLLRICSVGESLDQEGSKPLESGSTRNAKLKPKNRHRTNNSHSNHEDNTPMVESHCDTDTGKKTFTCEVCGKAFKNRYNMKKHYSSHTGEKPFACESCKKSFSDRAQLKVHMRTHTGEKLYLVQKIQEELCTSQEEEQLGRKQETNTFGVTAAHEESDHSEPKSNSDQLLFSISKPYLGKRFSDPAAFTRHTEIHTSEKPYSCTTCRKSYTTNSKLIVHMRTHTDEKPYTCNTCGRRFNRTSILKVHMRTHTGERPYSCTTCGKSFTYSTSLKVHMRTHTGEKPYVCTTCGKGFTDTSAHKRHMAIHKEEKPYSCGTCGKSFRHSYPLKIHMRNHTSEKLYKNCAVVLKHLSKK